MSKCVDHLEFCDDTCPDCGEAVDSYGNTEYQFEHCAFPDCGCDGERLCMAGEASPRAITENVEGMWIGNSRKHREARARLMASVHEDDVRR